MTTDSYTLDATAASTADFINRVLSAAHASPVESLCTLDLTVSQVRMLFVLMRNGSPMPVHEVADGVGLSVAAAGRAADRMVAAGLIDRREDERDRRVKRLSLTTAGDDLLDAHFRVCGPDLSAILSDLPDDVRHRLRAALDEAASHLPPAILQHTPDPR